MKRITIQVLHVYELDVTNDEWLNIYGMQTTDIAKRGKLGHGTLADCGGLVVEKTEQVAYVGVRGHRLCRPQPVERTGRRVLDQPSVDRVAVDDAWSSLGTLTGVDASSED